MYLNWHNFEEVFERRSTAQHDIGFPKGPVFRQSFQSIAGQPIRGIVFGFLRSGEETGKRLAR